MATVHDRGYNKIMRLMSRVTGEYYPIQPTENLLKWNGKIHK